MKVIAWFFPFAVAITLVCGILYGLVQQDIRQNANDPQIQMAEDAGVELSHNAPIGDVIPVKKVEIDRSLAPFIIVYDEKGNVMGSSADLNGHNPELPPGILDRSHWQDALSDTILRGRHL